MSDAIELVQRFCDAWANGASIDELLGHLAPDAVYHNIPMDPLVGHDAIRATLELFLTGVDGVEFVTNHIAAVGDVVLTERVDIFRYPDKTIELPVMGTFEVANGMITAWRDYFDLNQYMTQLNG